METYKEGFADFLLSNDVLKMGAFKLKSGRESPYFVNTGVLAEGEGIGMLGFFYASKIDAMFDQEDYDAIFGPAYKGIPLAVTTAISLAEAFDTNKRILFDRKLPKNHGEATTTEEFKKNWLIGNIKDGDRILIVDDVFTTGKTKYDSIDLLNKCAKDLKFVGMVISVDRQEYTGSPQSDEDRTSAIDAFVKKTKIPVESIITITDIVEHLKEKSCISSIDEMNIKKYLEKYGTNEAIRRIEKWEK